MKITFNICSVSALVSMVICSGACSSEAQVEQFDSDMLDMSAAQDATHVDFSWLEDMPGEGPDASFPVEDAMHDLSDDIEPVDMPDAGDLEPYDQSTAGDAEMDLDMFMPPWNEAESYSPGGSPWGDMFINVGSGGQTLELLQQGDIVFWEAGPQGGYHMWVGSVMDEVFLASLSESDRDEVLIRYRIWRQDGTLLAMTQRLGGLQQDQYGNWLSVGQYAVLEAPIRPRRLDGEQLLYQVDVTLPQDANSYYSAVWITSQCCD